MSLKLLLRNGFVLAGLLCLIVGTGDLVAGRSKVLQYQEVLHSADTTVASDPPELFPTPTESAKRHEAALAKLSFYQLLIAAGQLLSLCGFVLMVIGVLRVRRHVVRIATNLSLVN
jgi:hypothetical protein